MNGDVLRDVLLPELEAVKPAAGGFMARCPAHDDGKASLSISVGKEQPVVLKCFAGCESEDILAKLGLTWADLSKPRERRADDAEVWTPYGTATAVYDYRDEHGQLLFQVLRTAGKQFPQRAPDPSRKSGWNWKLGDTRRVLYRLPELIEAIKDGCDVWIVEGERDVHTLEARGLVATTSPGGAGKWRDGYAEVLREAVVTVVADADNPGRAHARKVAASLEGVARSVRIVEAAVGKDVTDHLKAGKSLAELEVTFDSTEPAPVDLAEDLWEFIAAGDEPYEWVVPGLLERGDRLILTGFEGLGKSMLIRQMATMMAAGLDPFKWTEMPPVRVLLIDLENSKRQSRRRFRPLA
ncbi:MAG: AAA family ATPase, partial [Stackebrandtia sp.]